MEENLKNAIVDDVLAEDFLTRDEFDEDVSYMRWRDDQCDALYDALKEVYETFVHPSTHGYYKDRNEKFLEHCVEHLKYFTECDLTAVDNTIIAVKREPKKILKVEKFDEVKNEKQTQTSELVEAGGGLK